MPDLQRILLLCLQLVSDMLKNTIAVCSQRYLKDAIAVHMSVVTNIKIILVYVCYQSYVINTIDMSMSVVTDIRTV